MLRFILLSVLFLAVVSMAQDVDSINVYQGKVDSLNDIYLKAVSAHTQQHTRASECKQLQTISLARAETALATRQYHLYAAAHTSDIDRQEHLAAAWLCKRDYDAAMLSYYRALRSDPPTVTHIRGS